MERTDPPGFFEAQLPAELSSVVAARRLVQSAGEAWGIEPSPLADAALAVSELAANAVLDAGTPMRVTARRLGQGMRIEVEDNNLHLPVVTVARPEDLLENRSMTGRGLALVAAMADRWGADPAAGGKVTWAEVGTGRRVVAAEAAPKFPPAVPASKPRMATSAPTRCWQRASRFQRWQWPPSRPGRQLSFRHAARAAASPPSVAAPSSTVTTSAITGGGRTVQLIGVPVALLVESNRHLADLQRELQVIARDLDRPAEIDAVIDGGSCLADIDRWTTAERRTGGRGHGERRSPARLPDNSFRRHARSHGPLRLVVAAPGRLVGPEAPVDAAGKQPRDGVPAVVPGRGAGSARRGFPAALPSGSARAGLVSRLRRRCKRSQRGERLVRVHVHVDLRVDDVLDDAVGSDNERGPLVGDEADATAHSIGPGHGPVVIGQEGEVELVFVSEPLLLVHFVGGYPDPLGSDLFEFGARSRKWQLSAVQPRVKAMG